MTECEPIMEETNNNLKKVDKNDLNNLTKIKNVSTNVISLMQALCIILRMYKGNFQNEKITQGKKSVDD